MPCRISAVGHGFLKFCFRVGGFLLQCAEQFSCCGIVDIAASAALERVGESAHDHRRQNLDRHAFHRGNDGIEGDAEFRGCKLLGQILADVAGLHAFECFFANDRPDNAVLRLQHERHEDIEHAG